MLISVLFAYQPVLGKLVQRPAKLDKKLSQELKSLADPDDPYDTVIGKTMCADDFYEGILSVYSIISCSLTAFSKIIRAKAWIKG